MSHCEVVTLPELQVEPYQIIEVLRCLFHTIIFNRALGTVKPREIDSELFDITWVNNGDEAVDTKLEQKIALIQACAEHNPGKHLDITLSFYERRQHQGWFAHQEQRIYWEQWRIHLAILSSDTSLLERHTLEADAFRAARKKTLQHLLEDCLLRIVTAVDRKRDHLPPVISGSPLTYPFDIKFAARATIVSNTSSSSSSSVSPATVQKESSDTTAAESESSVFGLDFVRRILSSSNPPSVLH